MIWSLIRWHDGWFFYRHDWYLSPKTDYQIVIYTLDDGSLGL